MIQQKIRNVLAATDFSATGNNAVMAAIDICKQHNAVLHLLHVVEKKYFVNVTEFGIGTALVNYDDQEARSQLYNMYERIVKNDEIMVRIHLPTGIAHEEICQAADELLADIVVIGAHGISGFKEFFIGSTAFRVIKKVKGTVLSVPKDFLPGHFKSILFPVRPVKGIIEKFQFLKPLLKRDCHVHIAVIHEKFKDDEVIDQNKQIAEILMSLHNLSVASSINVYVTNDPASKVLELCDKLAADLLVINATLDYNWTHMFTGPYTQQVVNHCTIPVISFRHHEPGNEVASNLQQHVPNYLR